MIKKSEASKIVIVFNNTIELWNVESGKITTREPILKSTLGKLFKAYTIDERLELSGETPPNLWYINQTKRIMVWESEMKKPFMIFDKENTGLDSGVYDIPKTVFKLKDGYLSAFCIKDKDKAIYKGPFFNTGSDGKVCLGTAKMNIEKSDTIIGIMNKAEMAFWNSSFTALNESDRTKTNLTTEMKRIKAGNLKFNEDILIQEYEDRKMIWN